MDVSCLGRVEMSSCSAEPGRKGDLGLSMLPTLLWLARRLAVGDTGEVGIASSTGLQSSRVLSLLTFTLVLALEPLQRFPFDDFCEIVGVKISTVSFSISSALAVVIIMALGGGGKILS